MNQDKDETVTMEEEVRIIIIHFDILSIIIIIITLFNHYFVLRIKMSVVQVRQQQIVVQINIKLKPMMTKKKMNQFILNPVHVLDGKNDVKLFVIFIC